jgi:hypothetical protein
MKTIAEYLEDATKFERMAQGEKDAEFKKRLLEQAAAYRKLAQNRAARLILRLPSVAPQSK